MNAIAVVSLSGVAMIVWGLGLAITVLTVVMCIVLGELARFDDRIKKLEYKVQKLKEQSDE